MRLDSPWGKTTVDGPDKLLGHFFMYRLLQLQVFVDILVTRVLGCKLCFGINILCYLLI